MLKVDDIKRIIVENNKSIRPIDASMIANYITSLYELGIVTDENIINSLINKACYILKGVVYYNPDDEEFLSKHEGLGKDNKGLSENNIIYINGHLSNEMAIITFFHELTHFLQTYYIYGKEKCVGVMQDYKYRLLMEAQTQNAAEMVFYNVFGVKKDLEDYKSEDLRMISGARFRSNLRNYQMYDQLLKEICVALGITVKEFISINFSGKKSTKIFENMIKDAYGEEMIKEINDALDIIYSSDVIKYNLCKTYLEEPYQVESLIDGKIISVSCKNQIKAIMYYEDMMILLSIKDDNKLANLVDNQIIPGRYSLSDIKAKRLD